MAMRQDCSIEDESRSGRALAGEKNHFREICVLSTEITRSKRTIEVFSTYYFCVSQCTSYIIDATTEMRGSQDNDEIIASYLPGEQNTKEAATSEHIHQQIRQRHHLYHHIFHQSRHLSLLK
jgi:hypothetical protein